MKPSLERLFRGPAGHVRAAILVLAAVVAALYEQILFRNHVLSERDIYAMLYPQVESFVRCFRMGSWPVWDPYVGFGQPMLANPGAQVFYPWTWLNLLFTPETFYTIYVTTHVLLSGIGLYVFSRRLPLSAGGSLTAAALWTSSGPVLSCVNLWQHLAGAAWIPWVLLAVDGALRAPSLFNALLLGAAVSGQILTGSVDLLAMTGLLAAVYSLRYLQRPFDQDTRRRIGWCLLGLTFAVALTAALWLPALDLFRSSSRPRLTEGVRTYWSVHPLMLIQCVLPAFLAEFPLKREYRELLFQGREPFLASFYLGIVAVPLVAAALLDSPRRRLVAFLGGVSTAAVLVALGSHSLFYGAAVTILPPLGMFRYPVKAIIVAAFCWSLLAGLGYEAWRRGLRARTAYWVAGLPLAASALAGLLLLALRLRGDALFALFLEPLATAPGFPDVLADFRANLVWACALGAAGAVLALLAGHKPARAGACATLVATLTILDLVRAHHDMSYALPRELLSRPLACIEVIPRRQITPPRFFGYDEYLARIVGKDFPLSLPDPVRRQRALQVYRFCQWANRWGLCGSYDIDPLQLYPAYLQDLNLVFAASEGKPAFERLLRIGAVSYVFSLHKEGMEGLTPIGPLPEPTLVFRVPDPLPRSYAVGGSRVAADLDGLRLLINPGFDFRHEIVLPSGIPVAAEPGFSGESQIVAFHPDRVRIEATLNRPGYVVLVDAYDPHWKVTVDGREAALLRANVAFRAVAVPAGTHVVEMKYRPRALTIGLAAAAAALVLGLGLSAYSRRMRIART